MKANVVNFEKACVSILNVDWEGMLGAVFGIGRNPSDPVFINGFDPMAVGLIESELMTLSNQQCIVIRCRFSKQKMTMEQIGKVLGMSRERVRQIEHMGMRKLRHPSRIYNLSKAIGYNF